MNCEKCTCGTNMEIGRHKELIICLNDGKVHLKDHECHIPTHEAKAEACNNILLCASKKFGESVKLAEKTYQYMDEGKLPLERSLEAAKLILGINY